MNFVSNKDLYQRIGRLDAIHSKRTSTRSVAVTLQENGGANLLNEKANKPSSSTTRSVKDYENLEDVKIQKNESTFMDTTTSTSNVIAAVTEGRGYAQCEIGLATIDVGSPTVLLSQFSDGFWYCGCITKLTILNPREIIIPLTFYNNGSKLMSAIKEHFPGAKITPVPRRHFNVEEGLHLIKTYSSPEFQNSIKFIEMKYYALSAASALLKYLKHVLDISFIASSLNIEYETRFARMLIDYNSSQRLELLYPLCATKEKKSCLFGVLDHTVTSVGRRFLRAAILEPFCDISNIENTQKCIQELLADTELFLSLEETLRRFHNVDQILKMCISPPQTDQIKAVEIMLNQVLLLKTVFENIPDLASLIRKCNSQLFEKLYHVLSDSRLSIMLIAIDEIIRPEVQFTKGSAQCFQRIHAVRSNVDDFLDLVREMYTKLADNIRETISDLSVKHDLPLRMIYTATKGFHMQLVLPKNRTEINIPSELNIIYKRGNNIYLTNPDLKKLNVRVDDVVKEIYTASDKIIRKLIGDLMQYVDANYFLVGAIASLDIILSLTKVSLSDGYCCPTFGDETRIVNAKHPLLEYTRKKPITVPNNILGTPEYNIFIITGPNMGGKTIYIKTIAVLQIMAQMGCFVPATKASFRLCDRIFTRIGFEDNVEQNASSFQTEMRELEYIFKNITPNSLVIIDELCRSTNSVEGKQLAWKLCEQFCTLMGIKNDGLYYKEEKRDNMVDTSIKETVKLSNITSPFIYITTHFLQLTKLAESYLNVSNLYLAAEESYVNDNLCIKYTHKVLVGVNSIKGYGMSLARCVRFPERILPRAHEIINNFIFEKRSSNEDSTSQLQYLNSNFENLEKALNMTTHSLIKEVNISRSNNVTNFINTSKNADTTANTTLQNVTIKEFLKDIEAQLYDLYSNIASYFEQKRRNPDQLGIDINTYICDFLKAQPKEFLIEICNISEQNSITSLGASQSISSRRTRSEQILKTPPQVDNAIKKLTKTNEASTSKFSIPSLMSKSKLSSSEIYKHNVSSNSSTKIAPEKNFSDRRSSDFQNKRNFTEKLKDEVRKPIKRAIFASVPRVTKIYSPGADAILSMPYIAPRKNNQFFEEREPKESIGKSGTNADFQLE